MRRLGLLHRRLLGNAAEQALLHVVLLALHAVSVPYQRIQQRTVVLVPRQISAARQVADRVERASEHQIFQRFLIDGLQIDPLYEIVHGLERPSFLARVDDILHGRLAHAFDSGQTETDIAPLVDREANLAVIDIGPQHREAHPLALVHEEADLLDVRQVAAQQRGHELGRIVGLQIGRLIGNVSVAGRVRLVERVRRERLPVPPYLLADFRVVPVLLRALDELGLHLVQHVALLLSHRLAQRVGLSPGKAGQLLRQQHDLLLIDRNAVRVLQILLHVGYLVRDGLQTVLAGDEVRNIFHRTGPVQRVHRDQVLETVRLQVAQVFFHAGRLELEQPRRLSPAVEVVSQRIVEGDRVDVGPAAGRRLDVLERILDDRQRLETQKVHLDQPDALDQLALVLHDVQLGVLRYGHRSELLQIVLSDNHAAGVHAGLAHGALEFLCVLHRVADQRIVRLLFLYQLGNFLVGLGESGPGLFGYQFRDAVALREGQLLYAGDVLDRGLRRHRAERDDLCDALAAVLLDHVVQHVGAAVLVEIDVHVRKRNPVGIQEALEQQVVLHRVDIGDRQRVGDDRPGRRAPARPHRDAHFPGGANKVPHDQEVPREAHPLDRRQFVLDTLADSVRQRAVASLGPLVGQML